MDYQGKYKIFDASKIKTYPVSTRSNKAKLADLQLPEKVLETKYEASEEALGNIQKIAKLIVEYRKANKPVVLFSGAHLIKNGLGPILADLVRRDMVS